MKVVVIAGIFVIMTLMFKPNHAAPQFLQGSETAGTQHGLSFGGFNLFNIGGGYSKGGSIGVLPGGRSDARGTGASAGGSTDFNLGLGPLQYNNQNSAAAQGSLTK